MSDFETFWQVYPRKVGKAMARAKFQQITNGGIEVTVRDRDQNAMKIHVSAAPDELIEAAKAARYDWKINPDLDTTPDCFIPHATTWLNQARFEDMDEAERQRKAARYDASCARMAERKLRVV